MVGPASRLPRVGVVERRDGPVRGRRGRGVRGPLALPGPLNPRGPSPRPTRRADFDDLVLTSVDRLAKRWGSEWGNVEFGTEDVPQLPEGWADEPVPFGSLVRGGPTGDHRIVVFRRPIEAHTTSRLERAALVNEVLVEHVAELLGRDPAEIDP